MSSRPPLNRSSFQIAASCVLFGLLLSAVDLTANSAVSGADKPKENTENSGAPDVSYPLDEFLDQCLARPNHGSTPTQVVVTKRARQRWNGGIHHNYRRSTNHPAPKTPTLYG